MIRPTYEYTIPVSLRGEGIPGKIGMKPLTAEQEIQASKVGGFNLMKAQYEAVKRAVAELDGKPANFADGDVDKLWDVMSPRLRALLVSAYSKMTSASEEEESSFFASEKMLVG